MDELYFQLISHDADIFEVWARQQEPAYCLQLNKCRFNEGPSWYKCPRTQHTFEGFIAGRVDKLHNIL